MAHPDRAEWVEQLMRDFPQATVAWDERNEEWHTGRRALLAYDPSATHHLVLQDDAIPSRDLLATCERIAGTLPVSLYAGRVRPRHKRVAAAVALARRTGASWLEWDGPKWGVALLLPVPQIPHMVARADERRTKYYDIRIAQYYAWAGERCLYTMPSLVDHRRESASLLGHSGVRCAHWFIGASASGLKHDWNRKRVQVELAGVTVFRDLRSGRTVRTEFGTPRHRRLSAHEAWAEIPTKEAA